MFTGFRWAPDRTPFSLEQLADISITVNDFTAALKLVQPSAMREGFATCPDVTWDDIGALKNVRRELERTILVR